MTCIWQIRDGNTGLFVENSGGGLTLTTQDRAFLWRREDLAQNALKKILRQFHKSFTYPKNLRGFKCFDNPGTTEYYETVNLEIVCCKLVFVQ